MPAGHRASPKEDSIRFRLTLAFARRGSHHVQRWLQRRHAIRAEFQRDYPAAQGRRDKPRFHPRSHQDVGNTWVDDLAFDTLMKYGPGQQPEPNLASSVTHPNPVTYVYHLRHGVKFWDGDPLTATDVAYALNYVRGPKSRAAYVFPAVKSITATDPYTVTVTLPAPDQAWVYTPAQNFTGIFEAKFAEAHQGSFGDPGTLVMGSGPWKVNSFDPTTGAELSANPHWWGGKAPIQHVSVKEFSDNTSMALAFRAGELDITDQFSDAKAFAAASGAKLITQPSCENGFVTMNTQTRRGTTSTSGARWPTR